MSRNLEFGVIFFVAFSMHTTLANAQCNRVFSGPVSSSSVPPYFFSSSCVDNSQAGVSYVENQVCSLRSTLGFYWHQLNWVSGKAGVKEGQCLYRKQRTDSFKLEANTKLETTSGEEQTHAYQAAVSKKDGSVQVTELTNGVARISGGQSKPFKAIVVMNQRTDLLTFSAFIAGDDVEFALVLPAEVKDVDSLIAEQVSSNVSYDNMKKIFTTGSEFSKKLTQGADQKLMEAFVKQNNIEGRGVLTLSKGTEISRIQLDRKSPGALVQAFSNSIGCIFVSSDLVGCSGL